jgi:hypothetical protein
MFHQTDICVSAQGTGQIVHRVERKEARHQFRISDDFFQTAGRLNACGCWQVEVTGHFGARRGARFSLPLNRSMLTSPWRPITSVPLKVSAATSPAIDAFGLFETLVRIHHRLPLIAGEGDVPKCDSSAHWINYSHIAFSSSVISAFSRSMSPPVVSTNC